MDITETKAIIDIHQQHMASYLELWQRFQNHFDTTIKQAKIYPNWAVVVFIVSLVMGFGTVVFEVLSFLR